MKVVFNKKIVIFLIVAFSIAFLYFGAKGTYTAYESIVNGKVGNKISQIHLKVNGEELESNDNVIVIDDVTWTSTHTRTGKLSPGSTGNFQFELDPTGSEVAILYEIELIDKTVDSTKMVTFQNVTCDRTLVRTSANVYSGIISLSDIQSSLKTHVTVYFAFLDDGDIEGIQEDNQVFDDFFEVHLHVLQYQGEELVAYTG
ncbi:MAG: hypothetical protein J6X28_03510 [Bacilli bacterium]|nr:hypothetical protein [Bacilli bacterium]